MENTLLTMAKEPRRWAECLLQSVSMHTRIAGLPEKDDTSMRCEFQSCITRADSTTNQRQ
jgi:hypothetical protein